MYSPNVLVAGAPKCGTTSIFGFLADHPDVCASSVKETCFLIDKDYPLYNPEYNVDEQGLEGYSQFFSHCKGTAPKVYLEATPDYLYQETPLKYLPELDPIPQIIIALRNPAERIYSMFQFARNNMAVIDARMTFAEFLAALRDPASEVLNDRPHLRDVMVQSRYAHYIERWLKVFGRDRVHVFLFEDLVRDPYRFMITLCDILGLDPEIYKTYKFDKRNVTRQVRFQLLHRLARRVRKLSSTSIPGRRLAGALYRHINAPPAPVNRSDEEMRLIEELNSEFVDDNRRLAELLGMDLTHWNSAK